MPDEDREKLRQDCHADLLALRTGGELPERASRLLERLVARLDRLETGSFPDEERPTAPERTKSGPWRNDGVLEALKRK